MTRGHLLRTLFVASLAALALAAASQARAEGGDGDSVYAAGAIEQDDPASEASVTEEAAAAVPAESVRKALSKPPAGKLPPAARAFASVPASDTEGETIVGKTTERAPIVLLPNPGTIPIARGLGSAPAVDKALSALIARHAAENRLPVELANAVVRIESRYNANARSGVHVGLTQINVETARSMGFKGDVSALFDADTNLRYGLRYLAQAYRLAGGDTCGTILRYQAGHRALVMTRAAQVYCSKVQTILARAE
jgi:soluble lytic murein transglycosylase-like protein